MDIPSYMKYVVENEPYGNLIPQWIYLTLDDSVDKIWHDWL